jgi:hypothetical protein
MPEISIVIPTRDRSQWLPRTLLSAMGQQRVESELVIVDDASRSPVEPHVLPPARVIRHDAPLGPAAARNSGLTEARGEWIAFLDDDDLWAPTRLRTLLDAALRTGASLAISGGLYIDAEGRVVLVKDPPADQVDLQTAVLAANLPFCSSNLVVHKELLEEVGGFDETLPHLADWDLAVRLTSAGTAVVAQGPLLACTLHGGNMQLDEAALAAELERFAKRHEPARRAMTVELDTLGWLRWRILAQRRGGSRLAAARAYARLGWKGRDAGSLARGLAIAILGPRAADAFARRGPHRHPEPPGWLPRATAPPPSEIAAVWR